MAPRVRFAPSPTGYLHVGGARTALFNWLFARRLGGVFVLRIEDTDAERSSWEMVAGIVDGMRWLGLDWDEGPDIDGPHAPYFQSQRLAKYQEHAHALVRDGRAYYCYCQPEELQRKRADAEARGEAWRYDRTCLARDPADAASLHAEDAPRAVRFHVPPGQTRFKDLVHGEIAFDNANIEDFVVLRSDGQPTYHLSVVVDDIDMAISHVVRGDDHISNTPKQALLYQAFGKPAPEFAHVPLIMGPDKKRLSKRHGATSVMEYQRLGYLPEAMVNFLALLGWSPGDDRELLSLDEMISEFRLEEVKSAPAFFDERKLQSVNSEYLRRLPTDEFVARAVRWFRDTWAPLAPLIQERARTLGEVPRMVDFLYLPEPVVDQQAWDKGVRRVPAFARILDDAIEAFATCEWTASSLHEVTQAVGEAAGVPQLGKAQAPIRLAVTGRDVGPPLFESLQLLGRERTLARLRAARSRLDDSGASTAT
jgi:glutamyl-tRNA synthetase